MAKKIFCILLFALFIQDGAGQSSTISTLFQSNFRKAELQYNHLAYRNALELYLIVIEKDPSNMIAKQRIADCYFRLGQIDEAEKWYAQIVAHPEHDTMFEYQYAQVLSIQGKYGDAEKWFQKYFQSNSSDLRAREKYEFMYLISYYYRDSTLYDIENLSLNSDQSDFAPQFYNDGITFVSARDRDLFIKRQSTSAINDKEAMLNIFYSTDASTVSPFYHKEINSSYHDGPIAFYNEGKSVAFTRSNLKNGKPVHHAGKVKLKLFFGKLNDSGELSNLDAFPYNDDAYSIGHPTLNNEGTVLYFSSDMPGGLGGADIYKSEKIGEKWNQPKNLGPLVNTLGDELFPYIVNDSIIYFSSNGHGGLGGLDIYYSVLKGNKFRSPENLGFPLNSSLDDFSLVLSSSGREGLFASNRPGGKGYDDIYKFTTRSFFLVGKVVERMDSAEKIAHVKVKWNKKGHSEVKETVTNDQGYFFADLDFDQDYNFSALKDGYASLDTLSYSTFIRYTGRDSIVLSLWKHALFAKGKIYNNETQLAMKDAFVILENFQSGKIDTIKTTSTGVYEFLVLPDTHYKVSAFKNGFIGRNFRLDTKGIFEGDLLNDLVLEEEFTEKEIVLFDYDKYEIKPSFVTDLKKVISTLKRLPTGTVHIGAHADSFGSHEYNQNLSENRAKAVKDFLISNGISSKRIEAVGFGEELLLNQCSNGVECSDEDHSKNRRAEIKVQMKPVR